MPGTKGMARSIKKETLRQKMWQTMRIKRRGFTIPDLVITVPGATYDNALKLVHRLLSHGIITGIGTYVGGRRGEYKGFRLRNDTGPMLPDTCPYCKKRMTAEGCGGTRP